VEPGCNDGTGTIGGVGAPTQPGIRFRGDAQLRGDAQIRVAP
jgi:hypothetical protein